MRRLVSRSATCRPLAIAGVLTVLAVARTEAGIVSPIQSLSRPLGLDVAGPVQLAGSDARSADFQQNVLPIFQQTVDANLGETQSVGDLSAIALDPSAMRLEYQSDVRVYFIGEGAGYRNTLGYFTTPYGEGGLSGTDAQLVFPDASSSVTYLDGGNTSGTRTASAPLLPGDFVDLGTLAAGTQYTPFLISNGANGGSDVYTPVPSDNADGIQHFVSLAVMTIQDSPYLLIGVEDLYGGGDEDYNDLVFAIDIGAANVQQLVSATVPLPRAVIALLGPLAWIGIVAARRRFRRRNWASNE
jgi:hypothetical protein